MKKAVIFFVSLILAVGQCSVYRGVASKVAVEAYDPNTYSAVSGKDANITATLSKDGQAPVAIGDVYPVNVGTSGSYVFDLNAAETDANLLILIPSCTAPNTHLDTVHIYTAWSPINANIWFVSKTGNNSNGGHLLGDALLTISAAVTAAAAGDTIIVGVGTFTEDVNIAVANLTIEGAGWGTIITQADGNKPTISLNTGSYIKNLQVCHTGNLFGPLKAVYATGKNNIRLENCLISSTVTAIRFNACDNMKVSDCIINSRQYGVYFYGGANPTPAGIIKNCFIVLSDWTNFLNYGVYCDSARLTVEDSAIGISGSNTDSIGAKAVSAANQISQLSVLNTTISISSDANLWERGLYASGAGSKLLAQNCNIYTNGTLQCYDLIQESSAELIIDNCRYNTARTSGTITNVSKQISDQTDNIPDINENLLAKINDSNDNLLAHITDSNGNLLTAINAIDVNVAGQLLSATGFTQGGTWTYAKLFKVMSAWAVGKWRDKAGSPGTYQILDPDDGTTVILEITPSATTPQKTVVIKI